MRKSALFFVVITFLFSLVSVAENPTEIKSRVVTDVGVIVRGMPKENLGNVGFSEDKLLSYNLSGNQEYMTFLDITLVGDNITFYLEDGKVKDWFRGTDVGTLEEDNE
ncbi:MAG: hypothetical protein K9L86_06445 [Candidatus Omnitrophica bacterium]|nr:hypothetical protein [Candidatus Omnitrophota bacterium]